MTLVVAVQMDPIQSVDVASDTTVLMLLEAQARGHALWVYGPERLTLENGRVFARARRLERLTTVQGEHATLGEERLIDLGEETDVVLMRQDPPFDMAYVTATYVLERIHPKTLVVNDPAAVRDWPEKLVAATRFSALQPPTLISADPAALADFHRRHGEVVLKPLHGNAGSGVVRLRPDDPNLGALLELHAAADRGPVVLQAFIEGVSAGDKRVLMVDGRPVGAVNRVPPKGAVRSNLRVGGRAEPVELSARDLEICAAVGPELAARGLLFVGLDVIAGYLTEINVTSPTGAQQLKRFGGGDAAAALWDAVEARRAAG